MSHSPRLRYAAPLYLLSGTGRSGYEFLGFSIAGKGALSFGNVSRTGAG